MASIIIYDFNGVDLEKELEEIKELSEIAEEIEGTEYDSLGEFKGEKIITKGIQHKVAPMLQQVLWQLVEQMDIKHKDYLQVFKLSVYNGYQIIEHTQEEPNYKRVFRVKTKIETTTTGTIFIQDDKASCTMLFSYEY